MPAERRVSDEDLARLRRLHSDGWTPSALAEAFGVSAAHVRRLVRGEQRAAIGDASGDRAVGDVLAALDDFISDADLDAGDDALAAMARVLARKIDDCAAATSATAAAATPRLAAQLIATLAELRDRAPRNPDALDALRDRHRRRRRALSAQQNGRERSGRHSHDDEEDTRWTT